MQLHRSIRSSSILIRSSNLPDNFMLVFVIKLDLRIEGQVLQLNSRRGLFVGLPSLYRVAFIIQGSDLGVNIYKGGIQVKRGLFK